MLVIWDAIAPVMSHCNGFINIDEAPGLWFMMKMSSYHYKNSYWETIAIIRSSYLHTGETTSLYWISLLDANAVYFRHVHLLGNCPKRHEKWKVPEKHHTSPNFHVSSHKKIRRRYNKLNNLQYDLSGRQKDVLRFARARDMICAFRVKWLSIW